LGVDLGARVPGAAGDPDNPAGIITPPPELVGSAAGLGEKIRADSLVVARRGIPDGFP